MLVDNSLDILGKEVAEEVDGKVHTVTVVGQALVQEEAVNHL